MHPAFFHTKGNFPLIGFHCPESASVTWWMRQFLPPVKNTPPVTLDIRSEFGDFLNLCFLFYSALIGIQPEFELVWIDRKSTRLNSSHVSISYAVFCLKKKNKV